MTLRERVEKAWARSHAAPPAALPAAALPAEAAPPKASAAGSTRLSEAGDALFESIKSYVDRRLAASPLRYTGVWDPSRKEYVRGEFATFKGGIFHCNVAYTKQQPGDGNDWTLAVKAGRDGRDLR